MQDFFLEAFAGDKFHYYMANVVVNILYDGMSEGEKLLIEHT